LGIISFIGLSSWFPAKTKKKLRIKGKSSIFNLIYATNNIFASWFVDFFQMEPRKKPVIIDKYDCFSDIVPF